MINYRIPNCSI